MEETLRDAAPADGWREALAKTIEKQRHRVGERIAGQRERLRELEARIAKQISEASDELAKAQHQTHDAAKQAEAKTSALLADLKQKEQSLVAREDQTQRQRRHIAQQLRSKKKELTAEAQLQRAQAAAVGAGKDGHLQGRLLELQAKYDRLRDEHKNREVQREEMTQRLAELKTQCEARQQEARQHQSAHEHTQKRLTEVEAERRKLQTELTRVLDESRRHSETARDDLSRRTGEAQAQAVEITRLSGELDRVRREAEEHIERIRADQGKSTDAQVKSLQQQLDELRKKLSSEESAWQHERQQLEVQLTESKASASKADPTELAKLRDENKRLEESLAEAEERAKQSGGGGGQDAEDLRRRFEMAVQDVRELKTKNAELTDQLAKARSASPGAASTGAQGSNWEALKQKLLADMESDFDDKDGAQKADKLTVQGAIKITDEVVAEKEHEIQELRRLLESQAQQVGEVAVGAAAVAQMLDTDELIRQERESLQRLQESLREQLRQAEVDNSVERAKLARERAELDEKLRGLEAERASMHPSGEGGGEKGKKGGGGRKWLARLGLGESKEE
jgi:hypothetical protein